jgi:hypothetical protein
VLIAEFAYRLVVVYIRDIPALISAQVVPTPTDFVRCIRQSFYSKHRESAISIQVMNGRTFVSQLGYASGGAGKMGLLVRHSPRLNS